MAEGADKSVSGKPGSVRNNIVSADASCTDRPTAEDWAFRSAAAIVFVAAVVLRVWGINFGLPNLYHPDEWRIVARALSFGTGSFHPGCPISSSL